MGITIDQLRAVEWSRSYLWEVQFTQPGYKFPHEFFPVTDVELPLASLESYEVTSKLNVPSSYGAHSISITFIDDIEHKISKWFEVWIKNQIFRKHDNKSYVSVLESSVRQISIRRLSLDKKTVIKGTDKFYWVYPEGELTFTGSNASDVVQYSITLMIVSSAKDPYNIGEN